MSTNSDCLSFIVEPLEQREMLAGNVVAEINSNGDIVINGDSESNEIQVNIDSEARSVRFAPTDGTTSINDAEVGSAFTIFHDGDLRDLKINMKAGDDEVVLFGDFSTLRNGRAQMGSGNDEFRILQTNFTKNVTVILGAGVADEGTQGGGFDQKGAVLFANIGGNLSIRGSKTIDFVQASGSRIDGRTNVQLGSGDDVLSTIGNTYGRSARANLGSGNDEMKIQSLTTFDRWTANGGSGEDVFEFLVQPNDFFSPPTITGFESVTSRQN